MHVYAWEDGTAIFSDKPLDPPPKYFPTTYLDEHYVEKEPTYGFRVKIPSDTNVVTIVPEFGYSWEPQKKCPAGFGLLMGDLRQIAMLGLTPKEYEQALNVLGDSVREDIDPYVLSKLHNLRLLEIKKH